VKARSVGSQVTSQSHQNGVELLAVSSKLTLLLVTHNIFISHQRPLDTVARRPLQSNHEQQFSSSQT
jgi:hypothetical protein